MGFVEVTKSRANLTLMVRFRDKVIWFSAAATRTFGDHTHIKVLVDPEERLVLFEATNYPDDWTLTRRNDAGSTIAAGRIALVIDVPYAIRLPAERTEKGLLVKLPESGSATRGV